MTWPLILMWVYADLKSRFPESKSTEIRSDLRDEIDLDSMDILRWVQGINKALGVEIPEEDYGKIASLGDAIDYVAGRI